MIQHLFYRPSVFDILTQTTWCPSLKISNSAHSSPYVETWVVYFWSLSVYILPGLGRRFTHLERAYPFTGSFVLLTTLKLHNIILNSTVVKILLFFMPRRQLYCWEDISGRSSYQTSWKPSFKRFISKTENRFKSSFVFPPTPKFPNIASSIYRSNQNISIFHTEKTNCIVEKIFQASHHIRHPRNRPLKCSFLSFKIVAKILSFYWQHQNYPIQLYIQKWSKYY